MTKKAQIRPFWEWRVGSYIRKWMCSVFGHRYKIVNYPISINSVKSRYSSYDSSPNVFYLEKKEFDTSNYICTRCHHVKFPDVQSEKIKDIMRSGQFTK